MINTVQVDYLTSTTKQVTIDVTIPSRLIMCVSSEKGAVCASDATTKLPLKT